MYHLIRFGKAIILMILLIQYLAYCYFCMLVLNLAKLEIILKYYSIYMLYYL